MPSAGPGDERAHRQLTEWISHDLRAPMADITVAVAALEACWLDEPARARTLCDDLTAAAARLRLVVDDLVELSRTGSEEGAPGAAPGASPAFDLAYRDVW